MKTSTITAVLAIAAISAGCTTSPTRSRNLADHNVPAKTLAQQVCSNCHGIDGNSVSPNFPKLAAQQEEYIVAQLKGFRSHRRADPEGYEYMWGISRSLSDAQIKGLAAYFSAQKSIPPGPGNPKLVAEGRKIFESGLPAQGVPPCSTCHGDHGQGNGQFPRVAYQHSDYVIKQLTVFQRTNERPDGVAMKAVTHSLSDKNMEAVAAYLQQMPSK
ncbi:MAG: cytochrome c4 [Burkholderiales bacterium]|nr:cytochrome c4 [Burkholderiales bacterium]